MGRLRNCWDTESSATQDPIRLSPNMPSHLLGRSTNPPSAVSIDSDATETIRVRITNLWEGRSQRGHRHGTSHWSGLSEFDLTRPVLSDGPDRQDLVLNRMGCEMSNPQTCV